MLSGSTTKIVSKGKVMTRNSILGYYPYTLFQTLPLTGKKRNAMAISMIEPRNAWYDIINEQGKKTKTLSQNIGEIVGYGPHFFIVRRSAWYDLYDESGKKYKTLSENIGIVISVTGETFVVRRSAWLDTYDRFGKKIDTRSAR